MGTALSIRDLNVDYQAARGTVHALRSVSFDVPENSTVGIVGESGCGKSTVAAACLRLLSGNAVVRGGEILFEGQDLLALPSQRLDEVRGQRIAMVFQDPMTAQNPVLSIGRQMVDIQYRRRDLARAAKWQAACRMLRRVGIADPEERLHQFPHEFSGGMRQRISIAMALLMNPALLIADEPTTALDVTMEAQIIHLIRELRRDFQGSVLFVSHNLGLIAELCDEVVVMYAGEVVEQGPVRDLFHRPQHPYTQRLLDCDPARVLERSDTLPTIPGQVPDLRRYAKGCSFEPRCELRFERCAVEPPPLYRAGAGHVARCHLLDGGEGTPKPIAAAAVAEGAATPKPDTDDTVLAIQGLGVRYPLGGPLTAFLTGRRQIWLDAVLDVSLRLRKGWTYGLAGESGSGKSTLARAILGLVEAHRGSIRFEGQELIGLDPRAFKRLRRDITMMFQDPVASLSPRRRARSLVAEPFEIHGVRDVDLDLEVERLFRMVGLSPDLFNRYPHELSGGQARRVGIARALALMPKLVVADEPTAGLDVSVQGEVLNLMGRLQRELGLTYLVISHNLPALRHISDWIGIMYMGRLVEQGPAERIFRGPAHPYARALLDGVPRPDPDHRRDIVSIEGEVPSLTDRPDGCEFHPRCPFATDLCRRTAPEERDLGGAHVARCHYPLEA